MANTLTVKKGDVIFREGTWKLEMYCVLSGKVGIYANYESPDEQLLTELSAGKYFGEMGVIEARARSATAIALEDTELEVIDSDNLMEFFENSPEKIVGILQNMTSRLRELSASYVDACEKISEYVEAENVSKPSLWQKLMNFFGGGDDYGAIYSEAMRMGYYDPFEYRNNWF